MVVIALQAHTVPLVEQQVLLLIVIPDFIVQTTSWRSPTPNVAQGIIVVGRRKVQHPLMARLETYVLLASTVPKVALRQIIAQKQHI